MMMVSVVKVTVNSPVLTAADTVESGASVVVICSDLIEQNFRVENASKLEVAPDGQAQLDGAEKLPPASKHAALIAVEFRARTAGPLENWLMRRYFHLFQHQIS